MSSEVDWRERFPEDVTCVRCLQVKSVQELDRLLWCEECLAKARRRAALRGWMAGVALAIVLGLYIWLVIQPDLSLIPTAWIATLAVALYLGGRVARELFYGYERLANRRAVEAVPPGTAPPEQSEEGRRDTRDK
jgi:hypothetical protein